MFLQTVGKREGALEIQLCPDLSAAAVAVSVSASSSRSASAGAVPAMTTSLPVDMSATSVLGPPKEDSASGAAGPEAQPVTGSANLR